MNVNPNVFLGLGELTSTMIKEYNIGKGINYEKKRCINTIIDNSHDFDNCLLFTYT